MKILLTLITIAIVVITIHAAQAQEPPKACDKYYDKAEFYASSGSGRVDSTSRMEGRVFIVQITTAGYADVPSMGFYAAMYMACREHQR